MTSRLNLKFVIPLAVAVVVVGIAGYVAATKFVFKSAAQHAAIAERAMEDGAAALAAGNIEEANAFHDRAAQNYNAANGKDPGNVQYLSRSMDANRAYVCDQLTEAQNRLGMIYSASKQIHDSPAADVDDQRQFYELLMRRHRMGLMIGGQLPWLSDIYRASREEYDANNDNDLARRWRGISGVFMLRNDMPPEERAVSLDDLQDALDKAGEDDPQLLHMMAVWHYNEAQRLRGAAGGAVTAASTEQFDLGLAYSERALAAAPDDTLTRYNHLAILMSTPLDEEVRDAIGRVLLPLARDLADNADTRADLFSAELNRVVAWLSAYPRLVAEETEAIPLALAIGEHYADDAPDRPDHHQVYVQALIADGDHAAALKQLEAGLAATRHLGPEDYLIDLQTKVAMRAQLVDTNIDLATQAREDEPARDAYLDAAEKALESYRDSENADTRFHDARASFLTGRILFARETPHLAIPHLEDANRFYKNSDLQTVALLAKAQDLNGNPGAAAQHYETLLQLEPRARNERLRLAQLYIQLGGADLAKASRHLTLFLEFNPEDVQARLLMARLLAANQQFAEAAAYVESIGLEANPQLTATYAQYLAQAGQNAEALTIIRERLSVEPNDTGALSILFTLIPGEAERLAELDQLIEQGLDPERAQSLRRTIETGGQMSLEEYLEFQRESGTPELTLKKQEYVAYAQSNQIDKMREVLAELAAMAPRDKSVLEWRFLLAILDGAYDEADRVIAEIMALPVAERPRLAAGDGAFMRARVLAGRAQAAAPEGEVGDLREAVRAYRRALEDYPSYAPGWVELGRSYLLQQDWARAVEALNRAYGINPTNIEAAMLYARSLRMSGEPALALDIYRDATRRAPNNRGLMEEYLALEAASGVRRLALEQRERMRDAQPGNVQNRQALAIMLAEDGRYEDALAEVNALVEAQGSTLLNVRAIASIHAMADDVQAGVDVLRGYLAQRGEEADARDYLVLAMYLQTHGRAEDAATAFEQAVALEDPATRLASREWASVLARTGRYPEAARLLQDLATTFPDEPAFRYDLASIAMATAEYDRARQTLEEVPDSAVRRRLLAQIEIQQGRPDAALSAVRDGLRAFANDPELTLLEASLLSQLGEQDLQAGQTERGRERITQARAIYQRLVQGHPARYEQRVMIARIDHRLGQRDAAIDQLVRILDENPSAVSARDALFSIYAQAAMELRENDPRRQQIAELAVNTIRPLVQQQPDNIEVIRRAGYAAGIAGNRTAAVGYAQRAYDLAGEPQDLVTLVAALMDNGQPGEALALLNAPERATDLASSLLLRSLQARALADSRRTDDARNLFTSLFRRASTNSDLREVFVQLRRSALRGEAVAIVEAALPSDRPGFLDLQLALVEQAGADYDAVIRRLGPWVDRPTDIAAVQQQGMLTLALAYQQAGGQDNLLAAKSIYESLLDRDSDTNNLQLLNNLADLLTEPALGQNYGDQAVAYARRAVALIHDRMPEADKARILDTLGWAQHRAGYSDDAVATLRQSIEAYPLAVNQKHLGLVYLAQNKPDLALLQLDNARRATNDPAERADIQTHIDQLRDNR